MNCSKDISSEELDTGADEHSDFIASRELLDCFEEEEQVGFVGKVGED